MEKFHSSRKKMYTYSFFLLFSSRQGIFRGNILSQVSIKILTVPCDSFLLHNTVVISRRRSFEVHVESDEPINLV